MNKQQGRITISRYAVSQGVIRGNKENIVEHRWYLWITRLYSCVNYREGNYRIEKNGSRDKFIYDSQETVHPMHISSFKKKPNPHNERGAHIEFYENKKFYLAVEELIIEWEDYQAEVVGYIHCEACEDLIDKSGLFKGTILSGILGSCIRNDFEVSFLSLIREFWAQQTLKEMPIGPNGVVLWTNHLK